MLVKTIDVYFATSKKSFFHIVEMDRIDGLIRLVDWDGKEFLLNWANVNFVEDMGLFEIEKGVKV
jgi:hypothetical protein